MLDSETFLDQSGSRHGGGHGGGGHGGGGGGGCDVPIDSPEPVTMIALAGGAAAVGAMSRRRKKGATSLKD